MGRLAGWIFLLYLAEGIPYGIFSEAVPVFLRTRGRGLTEIGLVSLIGLPWSVKFLWAPLVDRYGGHRIWIAAALGLMAATLLVLPGLPSVAAAAWIAATLLLFTLASATQDVAADAYTISCVPRDAIGTANGIRVAAYRIGLVLGGGGIVALAESGGWRGPFVAAAALFALLGAGLLRLPPLAGRREPVANPLPGLWAWLRRPNAVPVLAFLLLYRLGDAAMAPMVKPFWVDSGMSLHEIGLIATTLGVGATIVGALAGGWLTTRFGIVRSLWSLGIAQAGSNLLYAAAAAGGSGKGAIYAVSLFESFSGGLATAAFLAFLMSICDRRQAATQYAILFAFYGLTRTLAGGLSGWGADRLGYPAYFALTFLLALPAYLLFPFLGRFVAPRAAGETGSS